MGSNDHQQQKAHLFNHVENQSKLPDVNTSINEGGPKTHDKPKDTGRQNVTETVVEVHTKDSKSKQCGWL